MAAPAANLDLIVGKRYDLARHATAVVELHASSGHLQKVTRTSSRFGALLPQVDYRLVAQAGHGNTASSEAA